MLHWLSTVGCTGIGTAGKKQVRQPQALLGVCQTCIRWCSGLAVSVLAKSGVVDSCVGCLLSAVCGWPAAGSVTTAGSGGRCLCQSTTALKMPWTA